MVRKGFTIVEMAMVLVVIGLLLVLSVKGKTALNTAKMRLEVAKLNKFEAAIQTNFSRSGTLPVDLGGGRLDSDSLVAKGFLVENDLKDKLHNNEWDFYFCTLPPAVTTYYTMNELTKKVCAVGSGALNAQLVCNIERLRDDENATDGRGRGWGSVLSRPASADYKDCDVMTGNLVYAYRIF